MLSSAAYSQPRQLNSTGTRISPKDSVSNRRARASPAGAMSRVWKGPLTLSGMQRRAPAACGSLLHRSLFAADDQLTRTVVVADLDTAQSRSLFAALRKGLAVQVQHGGHAAVDAAGGIGHGFAAVGGQLDGLFRGEHPGCFQRGIFAEGKPGGVCGLYALFGQHCGHAAGKGHHAGLGVLGLPQNAVRVLEADAVQVKIQHGAVECGPEGGRCFVKFFAHAGVLRTLAGIQHGKFHAFCLHSVTSSSISSRTVYIRSSRPTLSPQKKRPSSTLPLTASISAWVMQ